METKQIVILAAVGLGAFVLMRQAKAGGVLAGVGVNPNLVNARPVYGGQLTPQQQAIMAQQQLEAAKLNTLFGLGSMVGKWFGGGTSGGTSGGNNWQTIMPVGTTTEIANDDLPGQAGYGWKYYSDGVAIGPDGTYYKDGVQVWMPNDYVAVNPPFNGFTPLVETTEPVWV